MGDKSHTHNGFFKLFSRGGSGKKPDGFSVTSPGAYAPRRADERLPPIKRVTAEALKIAMEHLGSSCPELEGLYRVSGHKLEVDRLKAMLEIGAPLPPEMLAHHDPHVVAGAIKKVLQNHEPLLTYKLYEEFMLIGNEGIGDAASKSVHYQELIDLLPPISRDLLGNVLNHLRKVSDLCNVNKMTVDNLAATIGVNLLRKSESIEGITIQRLEKERTVVMDLIRSPTIFVDGNSRPPSFRPFSGLMKRDGSAGSNGASSRKGSSRSLDQNDEEVPRQRWWSLTNSGGAGGGSNGQRRLSVKEVLAGLADGSSPTKMASNGSSGFVLPPSIIIKPQQEEEQQQQQRDGTVGSEEGGSDSPHSPALSEARGHSPRPFMDSTDGAEEGLQDRKKREEEVGVDGFEPRGVGASPMAILIRELSEKLPLAAIGPSGESSSSSPPYIPVRAVPVFGFLPQQQPTLFLPRQPALAGQRGGDEQPLPSPAIIPQVEVLFQRPRKPHSRRPSSNPDLPSEGEERVILPRAQEPFLLRRSSSALSVSGGAASSAFVTATLSRGEKTGEAEEAPSVPPSQQPLPEKDGEAAAMSILRVGKPPRNSAAESRALGDRACREEGALTDSSAGSSRGGGRLSTSRPEKPLRKLSRTISRGAKINDVPAVDATLADNGSKSSSSGNINVPPLPNLPPPPAVDAPSRPSPDSATPGVSPSTGLPRDSAKTIKVLKNELEEQKSRCRMLEEKLRVTEESWGVEFEKLKQSNTTSKEALDRLASELAVVKNHLVAKEEEMSSMVEHLRGKHVTEGRKEGEGTMMMVVQEEPPKPLSQLPVMAAFPSQGQGSMRRRSHPLVHNRTIRSELEGENFYNRRQSLPLGLEGSWGDGGEDRPRSGGSRRSGPVIRRARSSGAAGGGACLRSGTLPSSFSSFSSSPSFRGLTRPNGGIGIGTGREDEGYAQARRRSSAAMKIFQTVEAAQKSLEDNLGHDLSKKEGI